MDSSHLKPSLERPRFLAESTLGRLAKWLRLAGFDAAYDPCRPEAERLACLCWQQQRIVLTRTQAVRNQLDEGEALYIRFNAPLEQIRQVIDELALSRQDLKPLTRCARCNNTLQDASEVGWQQGIPDHVLQVHKRFKHCAVCDRYYWPGSHVSRWLAFMNQWFVS